VINETVSGVQQVGASSVVIELVRQFLNADIRATSWDAFVGDAIANALAAAIDRP
jgi:hypothetical protein